MTQQQRYKAYLAAVRAALNDRTILLLSRTEYRDALEEIFTDVESMLDAINDEIRDGKE